MVAPGLDLVVYSISLFQLRSVAIPRSQEHLRGARSFKPLVVPAGHLETISGCFAAGESTHIMQNLYHLFATPTSHKAIAFVLAKSRSRTINANLLVAACVDEASYTPHSLDSLACLLALVCLPFRLTCAGPEDCQTCQSTCLRSWLCADGKNQI